MVVLENPTTFPRALINVCLLFGRPHCSFQGDCCPLSPRHSSNSCRVGLSRLRVCKSVLSLSVGRSDPRGLLPSFLFKPFFRKKKLCANLLQVLYFAISIFTPSAKTTLAHNSLLHQIFQLAIYLAFCRGRCYAIDLYRFC